MHWLGETCALGVTLGFAFIYDWQAADLVWSLWLSSLVVGYSVMVSQCLHMPLGVLKGALQERARFTFAQIALGVAAVVAFNAFVLAFFTFHFGFFHYIHGFIMSGILSPHGSDYPESAWGLPQFVVDVMPHYYGMVLASAYLQRRLILSPEGLQRVQEPYKGVIKMHLIILAFVALHLVGATNFVFYAVTLTVYFFPWRELKHKAAGPFAKVTETESRDVTSLELEKLQCDDTTSL